ncbi:MAG: ribose 5-phosphate isomerase B [Anaerolineales bacterium]|nr:ribose 5-phosphate isomerase B [Anaerolineales bacterium]
MENLSDADLQKIVDEVVSSLMREMPSTISAQEPSTKDSIESSSSSNNKTVALGADHGGFLLKENLKRFLSDQDYKVIDCGTSSGDSVDYPDFARAVAEHVQEGKAWRGIMIDGAGIGSCMAANKVPGVRAAMCYDYATAFNSREHNNANLLTLGAGLIGPNLAKQIVTTFLDTDFGGGRHTRRVDKIMEIEK